MYVSSEASECQIEREGEEVYYAERREDIIRKRRLLWPRSLPYLFERADTHTHTLYFCYTLQTFAMHVQKPAALVVQAFLASMQTNIQRAFLPLIRKKRLKVFDRACVHNNWIKMGERNVFQVIIFPTLFCFFFSHSSRLASY